MLFTLPEDARWNAERQAVEFGVEIGEYRVGSGPRGACSKGCAGTAHPRAVRLMPAAANGPASSGTATPPTEL
jgi:hypothetical protein